MGGHYGSIHVRTEDAKAVREAVENLGHPATRKFLIAPAINGWVTVFPENHGQDQSVSEALAARMPNMAMIHCTVHDDDVFAYWIYDGGKVTEAFNSCPDYFDDDSSLPRGGDASALAKFAGDEKVAAIQELLDGERGTFEVERLEKFGKLVGLPNIVAAYEYIESGDAGALKRKREFVRVPDRKNERKRRKEQKTRIIEEWKTLHRQKILLLDLPFDMGGNNCAWVAHPSRAEVIASWCQMNNAEPEKTSWRKYVAPEWKAQEFANPPLGAPNSLALSRSGRYIAFAHWQRLEIWDLTTNAMALERSFPRAVTAIQFSLDEKWIFAVASNSPKTELHRISLTNSNEDAFISFEEFHFQSLEMHPGGDFIAAIDTGGMLLVVDITSLKIVSQRWIVDPESLLLQPLFQEAAEEMSGKVLAMIPKKDHAAHRKMLQRHYLPADRIRVCCFNPDGSWIFLGTGRGLRGVKWEDVLDGLELSEMKPAISIDSEVARHESNDGHFDESRLTYAVLFDPARDRILYSGLEGKVSFLDLRDGNRGTLLKVPGGAALVDLGISSDRRALIATARECNFNDNRERPQRFQIWNYRALCERAGIDY